MWHLSMRGEKVREWTELGEFQSISDAASRVRKLEGNLNPAIFFRVYVDPLIAKAFYLLTRRAN